MEFVLLLTFVLPFGIIFWLYTRKSKKPLPYPPGPLGIPILGNILSMGVEPLKTLLKWKMIYGPIFSIQLGSYPAIILNDERTIKKAFSSSVFAGRPNTPFFIDASRKRGLVTGEGPEITAQKRFVVKCLKKFVQADTLSMEAKLKTEIGESVENLRMKSGQIIEMNHLFRRPIINAVWSLLVGKRFESEDTQFHILSNGLTKIARFDGMLTKLSFVVKPISQYIPEFSGYNQLLRGFHNFFDFMDNEFKEGGIGRIPGSPRNFTESYMDKIDATVDLDSSFHKQNHYYKETSGELFMATMETIGSTIDFFFLHMLRYPNVCEAVQDEIYSIVGSGRPPTLADRLVMNYTQATIQESLRYSPILPLSVYHRAVEDTQFEGYFIPKDTLVIGNLYAANYDQDVWGDPEVFRPERFLHESTGETKKQESILTFSYGKRICPGEALARDFMFLCVTMILQQFNICLPPEASLPSLETIPGFTFSPQNFNIIFSTRQVENNMHDKIIA